MKTYQYILQPYKGSKTRFHCPSCNHTRKTFSRYINITTGENIGLNVGRCDREVKCGYHFTPKQYFEKNGQWNEISKYISTKSNLQTTLVKKHSLIPHETLNDSFNLFPLDNLQIYLQGLFGVHLGSKLAQKYLLGSSEHWKGATIFWQVDVESKIRSGKIILYDPQTGRRVKNPYNHITWVHTILKLPSYQLKQCLFGEHLLNTSEKPVAIVESEKTAIIASVFLPQFIWLASGSLSNLSLEKLKIADDRNIFLFPDLLCYKKWREKANQIEPLLKRKIIVSDFLEKNANQYEKERGLDIADFLINRDEKFGWALSENGYPVFWDYPSPE